MARKKAKKRGVKPGTKRGPYKKRKGKRSNASLEAKLAKALAITKERLDKTSSWKVSENQVGPGLVAEYTPKSPLTLCGQLEDSILLLEQRISNAIAKINSLM